VFLFLRVLLSKSKQVCKQTSTTPKIHIKNKQLYRHCRGKRIVNMFTLTGWISSRTWVSWEILTTGTWRQTKADFGQFALSCWFRMGEDDLKVSFSHMFFLLGSRAYHVLPNIHWHNISQCYVLYQLIINHLDEIWISQTWDVTYPSVIPWCYKKGTVVSHFHPRVERFPLQCGCPARRIC
jgi:hypothetical protein